MESACEISVSRATQVVSGKSPRDDSCSRRRIMTGHRVERQSPAGGSRGAYGRCTVVQCQPQHVGSWQECSVVAGKKGALLIQGGHYRVEGGVNRLLTFCRKYRIL